VRLYQVSSYKMLHNVTLLSYICVLHNVTQCYVLDGVDLPLFIHTVLHSLLPQQMLIANEQIQVLRIVGQGESIALNQCTSKY